MIFAQQGNAPDHQAALTARRPVIEGSSDRALPWPCVHEFISITTNPRIYRPSSTLAQALGFVESLMTSPGLHLLSESPGHFARLSELALSARPSGARIHDARIAALCLHHGVRELWSAGRDFSAFPQLKTRNPLVNS